MERLDHDCRGGSNHVDLALIKPPAGSPPVKFTNYSFQSMIGETLGIASISANARARGFSVLYLDAYFEELTVQQTISTTVRHAPSIIGVLLRYPYVSIVKEITDALRLHLPRSTIIVGGQYPSINSKLVLEWLPSIDGVCIGDGEAAILNLLAEREDLSRRGSSILWRDDGRNQIATDKRAAKSSAVPLDELAWPDRKYLHIAQEFGYKAVGISSSRGCPFRCSYCVPHVYSQNSIERPWNHRSATSIADEMQYHYDNGQRLFTFSDEHFLPNKMAKRRALEWAAKIEDRKLSDLKFMFDCRADAVDEELFAVLKKAGLYRVYIGFEAAENGMLLDYRKDVKMEIYSETLRVLSRLGIEAIPGMIIFSPTTTVGEIRKNIEFFSENFSTYAEEDFLSRLQVLPGTPIANSLKNQGLLGGMIEGEYSWRFRESAVESLWNDFNEIVKGRSDDFLNLQAHDGHALSVLKKEIELDLLGAVRARMQ
ncbi:B12-binding domain-containing radical SAM protein [Rhizobium leguminosarum]|uniref:B12-binding domain-containing radical SAM protein n=1 Tax=Rhizobium leguminosarum TaxID=384 RepID=UPI0004B701BB|nr:radical SAM protein [Rhizobium leguminosarum]UIK14240.1 radical SAM protein [Rhizobium leguminosarum]WFT90663.1 radical SAM protein [Rhizobium leguminosarum]